PDGAGEITTAALGEEAAKKSELPIEAYCPRDDATRLMRERLKGHRKIGIHAAELTHATFERLRTIAPKSAKFVDISDAVMEARLVKDAREVEMIQRACSIASRSFEEILPFIPGGVTEAEVAAELVYRMQRNGASGPSFRTIVGSGPNGAEPHYTAGPRQIQGGDMIVSDFGATCR